MVAEPSRKVALTCVIQWIVVTKVRLTLKMVSFFKRMQIAVDPAISSFKFSSRTHKWVEDGAS